MQNMSVIAARLGRPLIVNSTKCCSLRSSLTGVSTSQRWLSRVTDSTTETAQGVSDNDVKGSRAGVPKLNVSDLSVYKTKKLSEIFRAVLVLRLCSWKRVTNNGIQLMGLGQKILGQRLFNYVMRLTFYGHFVGGQTDGQIRMVVERLRSAGVGTIFFVPTEEVTESLKDSDQVYEDNLQKVLDSIDRAKLLDKSAPIAQFKLTALIPVELCEVLSQLIPDPLADNCSAINTIVRYLEGQPLHIDGLSGHNTQVLARALDRLRFVGERIVSKNVRLLIDAEYTFMNPALRLVALATMLVYNKERPLVAFTYQNYLKQTHEQLKEDIAMIRSHGACFAVKLVRGAYIVQERERARRNQYPDPVHDTFEDTTRTYSRSVELLLDKIREDPDKFYVIIATHNQDSVVHGITEIARRNIDMKFGSVFFGQQYGMDDSLSCALGHSGHLVYKSVPMGSVEETLPYLYRRAVENSTFLSTRQMNSPDRRLLKMALLDRLTLGLLPRNKSLS